jgi:hypothetical protein
MSWAEDHLNRPTVDGDGNPYYPDERREAWAEGYDAALAYMVRLEPDVVDLDS